MFRRILEHVHQVTLRASTLSVSNWELSRRVQDSATLLGAPRLTDADPHMRHLLLALLHLAVVSAIALRSLRRPSRPTSAIGLLRSLPMAGPLGGSRPRSAGAAAEGSLDAPKRSRTIDPGATPVTTSTRRVIPARWPHARAALTHPPLGTSQDTPCGYGLLGMRRSRDNRGREAWRQTA